MDGRVEGEACDGAMVIDSVAAVWDETENDENRRGAGEGLCARGVHGGVQEVHSEVGSGGDEGGDYGGSGEEERRKRNIEHRTLNIEL
jgi:hypothetical protein